MSHTEAIRLLTAEAEIRESMSKPIGAAVSHAFAEDNRRIASELRASAAYLRNSVGMVGLPVKGDVS